ncbi:MAG: hypothetical protein EBT93_00340 [Alphaproteobacteria bacterium]|nr:hypothetical protein [Alphaproteobacteria bacterium]
MLSYHQHIETFALPLVTRSDAGRTNEDRALWSTRVAHPGNYATLVGYECSDAFGYGLSMNDPGEILSSWAEFRLSPPSEFLLTCLRYIHDYTDSHGQAIFSPRTATGLTTMIASRSYGPELYRMCAMIAGASASGIKPGELLVAGRATPSRIRQIFSDADRPHALLIEDDQLVFANHQPIWRQAFSRAPLSVALASFLAEALGFDVFLDAYHKLGQDIEASSIKTIANDLSKRLYRFLAEHLPRSSERQITLLLQQYLEQSLSPDAKLSESNITDEIIFDFWCEKSLDKEVSLKLYDTCLRAWVTFRSGVVIASQSRFSSADSLTDDEHRLDHLTIDHFYGENDDVSFLEAGPKAFQSSMVLSGDKSSGLKAGFDGLAVPPADSIKMFSNTERDKIELLAHANDQAIPLKQSMLRGMVFPLMQNRLTQATRVSKKQPDINTVMAEAGPNPYQNCVEAWADIQTVALGTARTACQRLIEEQQLAGLALLTSMLDDEEKHELISLMHEAGVTSDQSALLAENLFDKLENRPAQSALNTILSELKSGARKYRRAGLKEAPADSDDHSAWHDGLYLAAGYAQMIANDLDIFLKEMESTGDTLETLYLKDQMIFKQQFNRIYKSEHGDG